MPPRLSTLRRLHPPPAAVISTGQSITNALQSSHFNDVLTTLPSCITSFSTGPKRFYARSSHEPTYYEILNVPVTATAAEIKKQFYALSLKHHPDRNRADPKANERFATISSAYHTLGDSSKRARYDLDHGLGGGGNTHSSGVAGQHPMGSHSSAGATYAGSRPASGLSKRRTAFRGPPPSFYAHGGYGQSTRQQGNSSSGTGGAYTGTGGHHSNINKEDPTSFIHDNPVWHFNAQGHYKTQTAEDARRKQRRSKQMQREREILENERSGSFVLRFFMVSSILVLTATLGAWLGDRKTVAAATAAAGGGGGGGKAVESSSQHRKKSLGTREQQ